ncbi:MAG TPA: hypothetical protein VGC29_02505 [Flavisolibacter sp.]
MKNKTFLSTLLIITALIFASCAGSRQGTGRKGYGCPSTVSIQHPSIEQSKV